MFILLLFIYTQYFYLKQTPKYDGRYKSSRSRQLWRYGTTTVIGARLYQTSGVDQILVPIERLFRCSGSVFASKIDFNQSKSSPKEKMS